MTKGRDGKPMEGVIRPKDSREPRRGNAPKDKRAEWRKARAEAVACARRVVVGTGAVDAGGGGEGDGEVASADGREGG